MTTTADKATDRAEAALWGLVSQAPATVDFHMDVLCPFAFQTARWLRGVREQIGLTINWRFFSLEEVNRVEGKKHPWEREWSYGWSMMRIGAYLRRTDMSLVDKWFETAGWALHVDGHRPHDPAVARYLLTQVGVEADVVDKAIADPTTHDEVKADHERVMNAGGFGVPSMFFGDQLLFGPVLMDPPTGAAALRLWYATTAWLEFPHLYEAQRPKTKADEEYIAQTIRPYLEARDWTSIDRGKTIDFGAHDPKRALHAGKYAR
jgi:2-hydroxychromene-2-carboxylate isomerase